MLSVIGGLTVMLGSSPLAAQATSATRSFDLATVEPSGTVTVTIAVAGYNPPGRIVETLPSGFAYVDGSLTGTGVSFSAGGSDLTQGVVAFNLLGASSFSYQVTAPSTEGGPHDFSGVLTHSPDTTIEYDVGGASSVMVEIGATTPDPEATPRPRGNARPRGNSRGITSADTGPC